MLAPGHLPGADRARGEGSGRLPDGGLSGMLAQGLMGLLFKREEIVKCG
jgi:hypothetical protein